MPEKTRLQALLEFKEADPDNQLTRYGLAMEYRSMGLMDQAMAEFRALLEKHPRYVPGYFQGGLCLARMGETDQAKNWLRLGITLAQEAGNAHAVSELTSALESLG